MGKIKKTIVQRELAPKGFISPKKIVANFFDHVDNKQLPKKIKPLPLHFRVVYLKRFHISH